MEELAAVLSNFGATGLWAVVIYQAMNWIGGLTLICLIGYGLKKAWPHIKDGL